MKKLLYIFSVVAIGLFMGTSCNKYVDINHNPNSPTEVPPAKLLPQAIVSFANAGIARSVYGGEVAGFIANAGGVSGWGTLVTYNYTTDYTGIFNTVYDNVTDLNIVISAAKEDESLTNFAAAAMVIKVYDFQNLVDIFNDVPFSEANQGAANITPVYDKGPDIYKSLALMCDTAISLFEKAESLGAGAEGLSAQSDPLFGGNINKWKQLANTLKLRLILRAGDKVQFANKTFNSVGFLTADAICNPGYSTSSSISPYWNQVFNASGSKQAGGFQQRVPTPYMLGFYNGDKITDDIRGALIFKDFPDVNNNQLGYTQDDADVSPNPNAWFIGSSASDYQGVGLFKGPSMGMPVMFASESYFLQAEGVLKGLIGGDMKADFENGIKASFNYLEQGETGSLVQSLINGIGDTIQLNVNANVNQYFEDNEENYLVNIDSAKNDAQKLEAIITQKYIASNQVFGLEAWNEFRRTGYPKSSASPLNNAVNSFVSLLSQSTAANKLPNRIRYPQSEQTYNEKNWKAAGGDKINVFTDKIFWAK
ncbi:SusD/RagB family nutrient-binding outer membrane lipoprotein [Arachidicoccus ginsenosidivorans]